MEIESFFDIKELFFSRTDHRGIILSGNSVFQRVSEFGWGDLIGAPHNLIRHQDMPRGVFYLLWEFLKENKPIVAYVKNKSQTGKFYWVIALVIPMQESYLSIRLKPTSEIFKTIQKEYESFLQSEKFNKRSPKESRDLIEARIQELGFQSYQEFMVKAFIQEVESRQSLINAAPIPAIAALKEIETIAQKVVEISNTIISKYSENGYLPLNIEIQSQLVGEEGKTVSVVASEFDKLSAEIKIGINGFSEVARSLKDIVSQSALEISAISLQNEIYSMFAQDTCEFPFDKNKEMDIVKDLCSERIRSTNEKVGKIESVAAMISNSSEKLRQTCTGLEIVRITGKVEISKITDLKSDLKGLLGQLTAFKEALFKSILQIEDFGGELKKEVQQIKSILRSMDL